MSLEHLSGDHNMTTKIPFDTESHLLLYTSNTLDLALSNIVFKLYFLNVYKFTLYKCCYSYPELYAHVEIVDKCSQICHDKLKS